ncbi:MAG: phenylacetate--CoA ligase family protein, partial [Phycisphaerae bacterium]
MYSVIVRKVLYPIDCWRTGRSAERRYRQEFEQSQFLPPAEIRERQLARLRRLLNHVYADCPFYRRRFDEAGIRPDDISSLEDMVGLPILEKRHIQLHRDEIVAAGWPKADLVPNLTGGSTGMPLSLFADRERMCSRAAATWRHNRWAGWEIGDKAAAIWGAARDAPPATWNSRLRNLLLDRRIFLNTACITAEKMRDFDRQLKSFRPKVILAYAKSAVLFARFLKHEGIAAYQPQAMVTSAEVLEDEERLLLEEVFGCPVFNRYGCREVSVIASECDRHNGMHIMAEGLYVEIVRDSRPARAGELGEVLVTDLLNYGMPLIRYRIGDMGVATSGRCPCGRGLPRLERLAGRVTDFLVGVDGRLVSGAVLTVAVIARRTSLGQVQLYQQQPGEVVYRIAPPEGRRPPSEDLEFLRDEARAYLGQDTVVDFEFVDHIPPEPSGKYRFCISK